MATAAAGLVTYAAEVRPEYVSTLRGLAGRVAAAVESTSPARRIETLSVLAGRPALEGLPGLDPVTVLRMAELCTPERYDYFGLSDVKARLFPLLLARHPDIALAQLYRAGWWSAMSLLESATSAPVAMLGADLAGPLASAIQRALRCVAHDGTAPKTFDGVDIERLAAVAAAQDRIRRP
jgi:hypothetical protein